MLVAALHRYCASCCARDLLGKLLDTEIVAVVDITPDIVFVAVLGTVLYGAQTKRPETKRPET